MKAKGQGYLVVSEDAVARTTPMVELVRVVNPLAPPPVLSDLDQLIVDRLIFGI